MEIESENSEDSSSDDKSENSDKFLKDSEKNKEN